MSKKKLPSFEEFEAIVDRDLAVSEATAKSKSIEIPSLKIKYLGFRRTQKSEVNRLKNILDQKKSELLVQYRFKDKYQWDRKEQLEIRIEGDISYQEALKDYNDNKDFLDYIDGVLDTINRISFNIANYVKLKGMDNGDEY